MGTKNTSALVIEFLRENNFTNQISVVDGQPGCGKTLFSNIIQSFQRAEIFNYVFELEFIIKLHKFEKISNDATDSLIKMLVDHKIYQNMMSRDVNFRYNDLSSVFKNPYPFRYFRRMFSAGDRSIPEKIIKTNPILNLTCHDLLFYSDILFKNLGNRLSFFEIIRHPLYMIKQQHINVKELEKSPRDVQLKFKYKDQELPYYAFGCEEEYYAASEIDKAVIIMKNLTKKNNLKRIELKKKENFLTVPFEQFVTSPNTFLSKICKILKTSYGSKTIRILKKNKVPRIKVEDGIDLPIYRIMGWQPPIKDLTIKDELTSRRNYAINNGISNRYLEELDMMSEDYIKNYSWF
jgi:hypothetical protein